MCDLVSMHFSALKLVQEYFVNYINNINKELNINEEIVKSYLECLNVFEPNKPKNIEIFARYFNVI